jgi:hypothetical protein
MAQFISTKRGASTGGHAAEREPSARTVLGGCLPGPPGTTPPLLDLPEICSDDVTCQEGPGCQYTCVVPADCPLPYDGCDIEGCCYIVVK